MQISPNGHRATDEQPTPLGQRLWFIAVMMFVFFPVGLVLFWRHDLFPPSVKWFVTVVVLGSVLWALFTVGSR